MKREIEFRGRTAKGEWVYGSFINSVVKGSSFGYIAGNNVVEPIQVMRKTVGQYVGIKDKNGKKIFEHDLLLKGFEKVVVKWNSNQCRWGIYLNGYEISGFNESTKDYFEVIGNIFDKESEK